MSFTNCHFVCDFKNPLLQIGVKWRSGLNCEVVRGAHLLVSHTTHVVFLLHHLNTVHYWVRVDKKFHGTLLPATEDTEAP
ncbi:unnamed protein product [Allacma fusca]|uniref:Uncharacterized protein n=1 Tax=Allacma fusca TaxID=39272 RepID=A0A8J2L3K2_9HEXA|nr:unnamed protein product [Allacma fusca]